MLPRLFIRLSDVVIAITIRLKKIHLQNSLAVQQLFISTSLLMISLLSILWIGHIFIDNDDYINKKNPPGGIHVLRDHLQFDASGTPTSMQLPDSFAWIFSAFHDDAKYRVVDRHGTVWLSSEPGAGALAPQGKSFDPKLERFDMECAGNPCQVVTAPVGPRPETYFLQAASSQRLDTLLRRGFYFSAKRTTIIVFWCAVAVFALALIFTYWRLLKPIRRVSAEAAAITPHTLNAYLNQDGIPREILPLVKSFNQTLALLEKGYRAQQEFLGSAAHELKTPLALIRAQIELAGELPSKKSLLRDIDLMTRQVHQLLNLAELSEIQNYQFAPTDPVAVAKDVANFLGRMAESKQVLIDVWVPASPGMIHADGSALFVLLKNLLENAIHHAPQDSVVCLTLSNQEITVRNSGPGIPPQDLPKLFTRFWRAENRHYDGAGLGLAICSEIAQAHGWQLGVRNTITGDGTVFALDMAPA
jgi:two-component system, OmpR family, sensor histidine kinase QseC